MKYLIESVTDADRDVFAALLHVFDTKDEMGKVAQNRNEFEGSLREVECDSGRQLISLIPRFLKQVRMDKAFCDVIKQSLSVFDGFVNRLGGDLVKSFCVGSEKAYSDDTVDFPLVLTHVSGADATIVSERSDGKREDEGGLSA